MSPFFFSISITIYPSIVEFDREFSSVSRRLAVPAPGYIAAHNNSINNTTTICIEYVKVTFDQRLTNDALDWRQEEEEEEDLENAKEEEDEDEWVKSRRENGCWKKEEEDENSVTGCLTKSSMLISKKKPVRSAFLTLNVFFFERIYSEWCKQTQT